MTNAEKAADRFRSGFNCAQSVLSVFSEKYHLSEEMALKMTSGLGSGLRSGEVCGVVSGAALVIGLKYGQYMADDRQAKKQCYEKTDEFLETFRKVNGSIICRELLGCDLSTKEGREKAERENLFWQICKDKIQSAVTLLEELGY